MARRLILDTGVLIAAERRRGGVGEVIASDDDVVIAAVTVAELLTGVELAGDRHRATRAAFVARIVDTIPVEPYDIGVARHHARLLAHTRRSGTPRGAHDLIVAATAVATNRTIVTTDLGARFAELPGIPDVIS